MQKQVRGLCCALLFAATVAAAPARAQATVKYQVRYKAAGESRVSVTVEIAQAVAGARTFVMPRAVPMGYAAQPYDGFVHDLRGWGRDGQPLEVARNDGPRWRVGTANSILTRVEYEIDLRAMEEKILDGGDVSRVRNGYLFLLGYSLFGFVEGFETQPIHLALRGPDRWQVCSTLGPPAPCAQGNLEAKAADFYALADSQAVMGEKASFERLESSTATPLFLSIYAETEADAARIADVSRKAFDGVQAYFGSAPLAHYTALFEFLKPASPAHRYGFSMEHLESATFCLPPERGLTGRSSEREVNLFLVNVAHHMAHAWVPKRAYGQGYFPFTWEVAPAHDSIWFSEGFGQYAALDALADAHPEAERSAYLERMLEARYRSTLRQMPKFLLEMPLVQLSYVGSYAYSEDFRVGRTLFSRGALMAHEMDARMRERTRGARRMRDALRSLVAWSARNKRAFRIEELPVIFREATGVDTRDILEKWLGPVREGMVAAEPR